MWPIFLLVAFIVLAILVAAHWVIYLTLSAWLGFKNIWLAIGFLTAPLVFVLASIAGSRFNNWLTNIVYYVSAVWLGLVNFLLVASILLWLFWLVAKIFNFTLPTVALMIVFVSLSCLLVVYGIINTYQLKIKTYEVSLPNLPAVWQGRTAVWLSDLHLGQIHKEAFSRRLTERVNALKPDIIFVGGDLFDGVAGDLSHLAAPFKDLKAPLGVYFITGNHEEFNNPNIYLSVVKDLGMRVLADESVEIDGVRLVGVNFHEGSNPGRLKQAIALLGFNIHNDKNQARFQTAFSQISDKSQPSILLNHYPGNLEIANEFGINLQLSGHSHAGQIWPANYITNLVYHGFDSGRHQYKDMTVITSNGAGTWGPPLRVGADPDILLIKFKN